MELLKDRRLTLVLIGGAVALAAGVAIALGLSLGRGADKPSSPAPASKGGLVVEAGPADDGKLDPARPLRCFVAGQFVGEITLVECAKRNGVATGALDVGVDETGALAAADVAGANLTPLPPVEGAPAQSGGEPLTAPSIDQGGQISPAGGCWRYAGEWRRLPGDLTLNACAQALFAGRCEHNGSASYGRWMQQTLRLVPGRVEISPDNRGFRTLAEQGPGCSLAPIG
jgi:hypothetical protein